MSQKSSFFFPFFLRFFTAPPPTPGTRGDRMVPAHRVEGALLLARPFFFHRGGSLILMWRRCPLGVAFSAKKGFSGRSLYPILSPWPEGLHKWHAPTFSGGSCR
jgi:hypothetical protein